MVVSAISDAVRISRAGLQALNRPNSCLVLVPWAYRCRKGVCCQPRGNFYRYHAVFAIFLPISEGQCKDVGKQSDFDAHVDN